MRGGGWRLPTATCFSDWHGLNHPTLVSYTASEGDLENCNHFHKVSCSKQYVSYSLSLPLYRSHLYYKQRPPTLLSKDHISLSQKFEALGEGRKRRRELGQNPWLGSLPEESGQNRENLIVSPKSFTHARHPHTRHITDWFTNTFFSPDPLIYLRFRLN